MEYIQNREFLEPLKFGYSVPISRHMYDMPGVRGQLSSFMQHEIDTLVLKLEAEVYGKKLDSSGTVRIPYMTKVRFPIKGTRKWYAPWKRNPDVIHETTVVGQVSVMANRFMLFPELQNLPPELGRPIPYTTYEVINND